MEEIQMVSIWVGIADEQEKAESLMEYVYDEDGNALAPKFVRASSMDDTYIDEDFVEVSFRESTSFLTDLITGHSYWESILPALLNRIDDKLLYKMNTTVLIYDFAYNGHVFDVTIDGVRMFYIGAVPFKET